MSDETSTHDARGEPIDWDSLARYLTGESPADEAERLRRALQADPERAALVAALDAPISRLSLDTPRDLDVEGALLRVRARMDDADVVPLARARGARRWWSSVPLRAAAVLMLVVAGGLLMLRLRNGGPAEVSFGEVRSYTTSFGERESVRLPDGSTVLLGPASEMMVESSYGEAARRVELRGEALFDVVHDADRPFTVRAGGAEIHDLGTSFTVSTDPGRGVRVAVTEGRVSLGAEGAPASAGTMLEAGDRALLAGGRAEVERSAELDADLAWTRGRLVFVETPLEEVAVELWRWYGAQLRVEDPALRSRELTASFETESLAEVLQVVRLAVGAELEMRGDTAVLRGVGRPAAR